MGKFALDIAALERLCNELTALDIVIDLDHNTVNCRCYDCESGCVGGCISHCDGDCGSDCSGYDYYSPW